MGMGLRQAQIQVIKVQGTARVGKSGFFIRYPFNYEGKQDMSGLLRNIQ